MLNVFELLHWPNSIFSNSEKPGPITPMQSNAGYCSCLKSKYRVPVNMIRVLVVNAGRVGSAALRNFNVNVKFVTICLASMQRQSIPIHSNPEICDLLLRYRWTVWNTLGQIQEAVWRLHWLESTFAKSRYLTTATPMQCNNTQWRALDWMSNIPRDPTEGILVNAGHVRAVAVRKAGSDGNFGFDANAVPWNPIQRPEALCWVVIE